MPHAKELEQNARERKALEQQAMDAIAAAIGSLEDPDSRRRVLQWVDDCFHTIAPLENNPPADLAVDDVDEFFGTPSSAVDVTASIEAADSDLWFEMVDSPADPGAGSENDAADAQVEPAPLRIEPAASGPLDSLVRDLASDLQRCAEALQQPA